MKKQMKKYSIFNKAILSRKNVYYIGYNVLLILYSVILLWFAFSDYSIEYWTSYWKNSALIILNLLPVIIWGNTVVCFCKSYSIAFGITEFFWGILASINYLKIVYRDDPLYFWDFRQVREGMAVGNSYLSAIPTKVIFFLITIVVLEILVCLLYRRRKVFVSIKIRLVSIMCVIVAIGVIGNNNIYDSSVDYTEVKAFSNTQHYVSHGFVYPFLHSIGLNINIHPFKYNTKKAKEELGKHPDSQIKIENRVDIISIMREAYYDFSNLDIKELDSTVYDDLAWIRENSYHGNLIVNAFAAGTYDTEWEFLTGRFYLNNTESSLFRGNSNSYVWYLRKQGYTTEGAHPFYGWSYNRKNINNFLGFEKYRFAEDDFWNLTEDYYPKDALLFSEIEKDYKKRNREKGYFSFSVTMEMHATYSSEFYGGEREYLGGEYSQECKNVVNNYLSMVDGSDEALCDLLRDLDNQEEPIVVVLFADHLPWMGNSNVYWDELGMRFNSINEDDEALLTAKYTTEYFIWGNEAAKNKTGSSFDGEGPTISPMYLMGEVFKKCNWKGPSYMQILESKERKVPVIHNSGYGYNGDTLTFDKELEDDDIQYLDNIQYYYSKQFMY